MTKSILVMTDNLELVTDENESLPVPGVSRGLIERTIVLDVVRMNLRRLAHGSRPWRFDLMLGEVILGTFTLADLFGSDTTDIDFADYHSGFWDGVAEALATLAKP